MIVNISKIEKEISFCDVLIGNVFRYEKHYYMKCVDLKNNSIGVNLCTGSSCTFGENVKVVPYPDTEVIIN